MYATLIILAALGFVFLVLLSCSIAERIRKAQDAEDEHAEEFNNWHRPDLIDGRSHKAEMHRVLHYRGRNKAA